VIEFEIELVVVIVVVGIVGQSAGIWYDISGGGKHTSRYADV
jgi:hypothetical protein